MADQTTITTPVNTNNHNNTQIPNVNNTYQQILDIYSEDQLWNLLNNVGGMFDNVNKSNGPGKQSDFCAIMGNDDIAKNVAQSMHANQCNITFTDIQTIQARQARKWCQYWYLTMMLIQ
jgi:hypothetical protein